MPNEFRSESEWRALLAGEMVRNGRYYYRIAYDVLRNADAAEDICQQAVATALQRPQALRDPESVFAWLSRVVERESLQLRRRGQIENRILERQLDRSMATCFDADWAKREAVLNAVEALPEPAKTIVTLRLLHGMSGNEVKERLNCHGSFVSRHMHQGMETLREVLQDWDPSGNNQHERGE